MDGMSRRKEAQEQIIHALADVSRDTALASVLGWLSLAKLEEICARLDEIHVETEEYTVLVEETAVVRYYVEANSHEAALEKYREGHGVWGSEEVVSHNVELVERSSDGEERKVVLSPDGLYVIKEEADVQDSGL